MSPLITLGSGFSFYVYPSSNFLCRDSNGRAIVNVNNTLIRVDGQHSDVMNDLPLEAVGGKISVNISGINFPISPDKVLAYDRISTLFPSETKWKTGKISSVSGNSIVVYNDARKVGIFKINANGKLHQLRACTNAYICPMEGTNGILTIMVDSIHGQIYDSNTDSIYCVYKLPREIGNYCNMIYGKDAHNYMLKNFTPHYLTKDKDNIIFAIQDEDVIGYSKVVDCEGHEFDLPLGMTLDSVDFTDSVKISYGVGHSTVPSSGLITYLSNVEHKSQSHEITSQSYILDIFPDYTPWMSLSIEHPKGNGKSARQVRLWMSEQIFRTLAAYYDNIDYLYLPLDEQTPEKMYRAYYDGFTRQFCYEYFSGLHSTTGLKSTVSVDIRKYYETKSLVCYQCSGYLGAGGSPNHPESVQYYATFNKKTGKRIALGDLCKDQASFDSLAILIKKGLYDYTDDSISKEQIKECFINKDSIGFFHDDFGINSDGLIYGGLDKEIYLEEDLGGPINILVPRINVVNLIKSEYLTSEKISKRQFKKNSLEPLVSHYNPYHVSSKKYNLSLEEAFSLSFNGLSASEAYQDMLKNEKHLTGMKLYILSLLSDELMRTDAGKGLEIKKYLRDESASWYGAENYLYVKLSEQISNACEELGEYAEAVSIDSLLCRVRKSYLYPTWLSLVYYNLGNIHYKMASNYFMLGDYQKSAEYFDKVHEEEDFGGYGPKDAALDAGFYFRYYSDYSRSCFMSGDTYKSLKLIRVLLPKYFNLLLNKDYDFFGKEAELAWYNQFVPYAALQTKDDSLTIAAFTSVMQAKNLKLNSEISLRELIMNSQDHEIKDLYLEIESNTKLIKQLKEQKKTIESIRELQEDVESRQYQLRKLSSGYGDYYRRLKIGFNELANKIEEGELAIEIQKVQLPTDTLYLAFTIKGGQKIPHLYNLGNLEKIADIGEAFWSALQGELLEVNTIFFSPDGILYKEPVEYARHPLTGSLINDACTVFRLSSTREVVIERSPEYSRETNKKKAVLYGGLDYNSGTEEIPVSANSVRSAH